VASCPTVLVSHTGMVDRYVVERRGIDGWGCEAYGD